MYFLKRSKKLLWFINVALKHLFISISLYGSFVLSYDSNMDDSRDNKKNRFSNTMVFMEEYLNNVLNDELPFHNEEKNKLTYEVCSANSHQRAL